MKNSQKYTDVASIPIVTVSYNAPDLISDLLKSIRDFYKNRIYVIDGSDEEKANAISSICKNHKNIEFIHFGYNIHHGPGMAWAWEHLGLNGPVLVLDSDVVLVKPGLLEAMLAELKPGMYGVGRINKVDTDGFNIDNQPDRIDAVPYLHPFCMLCNSEVVRQWPMPTKHGAPNIAPMLAIHQSGKNELIHHIVAVGEDYDKNNNNPSYSPNYMHHEQQGTVLRTGSYHLDEWMQDMIEKSSNCDKEHNPQNYNHDLLQIIPPDTPYIIEVGCGNGALAKAYKAHNISSRYIGIEIDEEKSKIAKEHCDYVLNIDIESMSEAFFYQNSNCKVWVFGNVLEHLRNPWGILKKIRKYIPTDGYVIACLPNIQHWSIQLKLSIGDFRYDPNGGLLDLTHLRFFTRATILEMFKDAGFQVELGFPRVFGELKNENIINGIRSMAAAAGVDSDTALQDSMALQYVVRCTPI